MECLSTSFVVTGGRSRDPGAVRALTEMILLIVLDLRAESTSSDPLGESLNCFSVYVHPWDLPHNRAHWWCGGLDLPEPGEPVVHLSAMYMPITHYAGALDCELRVHREQGRQFHSVGEMGTGHGNQRTRKQDGVTGQCLGGGGENNDEVMKGRLPGEAQGSRGPGRGNY